MKPLHDLLCATRRNQSKVTRPDSLEQFHSDQSRIIFASSFRHMVQKAQVFPLEPNTSVRNRLTHTLEVADVGKTLGRKVARLLAERGLATVDDGRCLEVIVGNACLLHDIGNPPFGHFGETAIRDWFRRTEIASSVHGHELCRDLRRFDGNPQGFRIATNLHNERDNFGLNLTAATLLAAVKYPSERGALEGDSRSRRKLGVFSTEEEAWQDACELASHDPNKRFALAYLMEAADDICYCTSDIADAIEKRIVSIEEFKRYFLAHVPEADAPDAIKDISAGTHFSIQVAVSLTREATSEVASVFVETLGSIIEVGAEEPLLEKVASGKVYNVLRRFAKERIYDDRDVQRVEIAGYHIIHGLLERMEELLRVPQEDFAGYIKGPGRPKPKGDPHDLAWRIFCQLGDRVRRAYATEASKRTDMNESVDKLLRYRMIVDYVAGLTDQYALTLHQIFSGSSL